MSIYKELMIHGSLKISIILHTKKEKVLLSKYTTVYQNIENQYCDPNFFSSIN